MRRSVIAVAAWGTAALALWASRGSLAFSVGDTPASRIGLLPAAWQLVVLLVLAVLIATRTRTWTPRVLPLLGTAVILLPWLPGPVPPAFLIWTGPVAKGVWLAVGVATLCAVEPALWGSARSWLTRPLAAIRVAALLSVVLYGAAAWRLAPLLPVGDEPNYLIITQSIIRDGDLQIENNHRRGDHFDYLDRALEPDFLRRGQNGAIYSIHAPGLPVLVAPAFALFGVAGARAVLVLFAAAAAALVWWLAYRVTGRVGAAWFAWAVMALSVPFFFHAFAVFPDAPAAMLVLTGVWALVDLTGASSAMAPPARQGPAQLSRPRWFLHGAALAVLPWLHTRYAILAVALAACLLARLGRGPGAGRRATAFLAVPAASAIAWFAFFKCVYGTFSPAAPYGGYTQSATAYVATGLSGLLFDQQFGLLPNAPCYGMAFVGLCWLVGRASEARRLGFELSLVVAPYLVMVGAYRMWWGGASAPARFAVPVLPTLALAAAVVWARSRTRTTRVFAVASVVASVWITGIRGLADAGRLLYDARDGAARWLVWLTPLADAPRALPSFIRDVWSTGLLHTAVWAALLLGAWVIVQAVERREDGRGVLSLAAVVSLCLAIMTASSVVWRLAGVAGTTPLEAQLDLLGRFDPVRTSLAVDYRGERVEAPAALLPRMRLGAVPMTGAEASPLGLPWLAAGTYRVWVEGADPVPVALASGEPVAPLGQYLGWPSAVIAVPSTDARSLSPRSLPEQLEVPVGLLAPVLDPGPGLAGRRIALQPLEVVAAQDHVAEGLARQVRRYGGTTVYLMGTGAYLEPGGFWIVPGAEVRVVLAPDAPGRSARLFLRNAPVVNRLAMSTGGWRREWDLAAGEEQLREVPMDPDRGVSLVRLRAANGFRPAQLDPSTGDFRSLGVWFEVR